MIDILLLAGVALCVLSVLLAIVSVARTRAPRGAAIALVLGLVLVFAGAWLDPRPFGVEALKESWQRLLDGQITLGTDPVSAPAPEAAAPAETAPAEPAPVETAPVETAPAPAAEAPAEAPAAETAPAAPASQ
ncbi:hypothetical protein [Paracoccus sp. N5]|uniref:hypothetical protein n=1 Tax=Paracoccus sp. N5 TaxID=1101189 RepID=UPI00039DF516|nr:hypothetical protein [Paracoccus sp. N5]